MAEQTPGDLVPLDRWHIPDVARIAPVATGELRMLHRLVLRVIRSRTGHPTDFTVFRTLARLRRVFPAHAVFLSQILARGHLSPAEKELVILQVAARSGCHYEWAHHSHMARALGIDDAQILGVSAKVPHSPDRRVQACVRAAAVLVDQGHLDGDEWSSVADVVGADAALELCMLVGHYVMVAMTIKSAGVQLEPAFAANLPGAIPRATPEQGVTP